MIISIIFVSANVLTFVYKGSVIGYIGSGNNLWTTIFILVLSLPSLIIAMITTVGPNFKILAQHPALVLLPTFTFFSFQKLKCGCFGGDPDHKFMFSKKMTMFNMLINGPCFGIVCRLLYIMDINFLAILPPPFILAVLLSMVFLYMEKCCGCCLTVSCCNIQDKGEVFDPDPEDVQDQDEVEMKEIQVQDEEQ